MNVIALLTINITPELLLCGLLFIIGIIALGGNYYTEQSRKFKEKIRQQFPGCTIQNPNEIDGSEAIIFYEGEFLTIRKDETGDLVSEVSDYTPDSLEEAL